MRDIVLPGAKDWQHRVGAPGYFVTKDGRFQTLIDDDGGFVICTTKETPGRGHRVVLGPRTSPEGLGIPEELVDEGRALMVERLVESLNAGEQVQVSLAGELAPKQKR